ncbi:MAG: cell division protein ZapA [Defluviitaleaceae bacterium]|nr:cell division protein ZapA [Defluviitaleaceae bacterium]
MEKNRVEVVIDGQIITLVSDENEAYMQKVALYIDKKLDEIKSSKSNKPVSEHLRTLLISLNIADDYHKALDKYQSLEGTHDAYIQEMGRMQEENYLLTEKLHELQTQLTYGREQYTREVRQLQEDNAMQNHKIQILHEQLEQTQSQYTLEMELLHQEMSRLKESNRDLQDKYQYAINELDEYISTFDDHDRDRKNVVSFSSGTGR